MPDRLDRRTLILLQLGHRAPRPVIPRPNLGIFHINLPSMGWARPIVYTLSPRFRHPAICVSYLRLASSGRSVDSQSAASYTSIQCRLFRLRSPAGTLSSFKPTACLSGRVASSSGCQAFVRSIPHTLRPTSRHRRLAGAIQQNRFASTPRAVSRNVASSIVRRCARPPANSKFRCASSSSDTLFHPSGT
jgi:hypothetical protein